jgi:site-specific DNA-methyltransferase (adenine-specific)
MSYLLIHGDARKLPVDPRSIDAVVSDPPYGMGWNTNSKRFTGGHQKQGEGRDDWGQIANDDKPFDPGPWLFYPKVLLFGANHYASRLPVGTTLVWIKRSDHTFGTFLSDAEVAWMKGGHGVYCFRSLEMFVINQNRNHPSQKPVSLIRWCIQKLKLEPGSLILDPYCGSGTTLIAAVQLGHRAIGIDIDRRYIEIARRRLERPHAPIQRPGRPESYPLFGEHT